MVTKEHRNYLTGQCNKTKIVFCAPVKAQVIITQERMGERRGKAKKDRGSLGGGGRDANWATMMTINKESVKREKKELSTLEYLRI